MFYHLQNRGLKPHKMCSPMKVILADSHKIQVSLKIKVLFKNAVSIIWDFINKRETLGTICEEAKAGIFIVKFVKPFTVCEIMWETTSWHSWRWYVTTCNIASDQVNTFQHFQQQLPLPAKLGQETLKEHGNNA